MENGGISQNELDKLLSGGLQNLSSTHTKYSPIWIIKDTTNNAVVGGRCWTELEARSLLAAAMKNYPDHNMVIQQLK